ncbi:MAG: hypothetical protein WD049_08585 [Candidatus Paceibacterota bacterium]
MRTPPLELTLDIKGAQPRKTFRGSLVIFETLGEKTLTITITGEVKQGQVTLVLTDPCVPPRFLKAHIACCWQHNNQLTPQTITSGTPAIDAIFELAHPLIERFLQANRPEMEIRFTPTAPEDCLVKAVRSMNDQ